METEVGGDKLKESTIPGRGKKRPLSPTSSPSDDGEDTPMSTSDDDDDRWEFSDEEQEEEGEENDEDDQVSLNNAQTIDCSEHCHCKATDLLQFIDIKIAGYRHTQPGHAKIFGFFAARDKIEPLRNYVYRRGVDNYEAVSVNQKTGMARLSLTSPARGICITSHALFEFELCIRTEDPSEDEPKGDVLIKGCTEISNMFGTESFVKTGRLYGEKCALDVKFAVLNIAIQAIVDVEILRAPACGFDLKLYARTSGFSDVIRLFEGVTEAGRRFSSVVAVVLRSHLDLRITGSLIDNSHLSNEGWTCRFNSWYHGTVDKEVNLDDFTTISVKVTWKAVADTRRLLKG